MTKATNMARVSVKGGFHLLWGLVISTIIMAVASIFVARILGESNYGLYTIALTTPDLISSFKDWGINSAMVRYSAQYNHENKFEKIHRVISTGFIFEVSLGLVLSAVCFFSAGFLSNNVFQRPSLVSLIQVGSFAIISGALVNTATATFTGTERMEMNSIMLVCQSIMKSLLMLAFVAMGTGSFGAISGHTIAFFVSGIIGVALVLSLFKQMPLTNRNEQSLFDNAKVMLKYGVPLSIGAIVTAFLTQYYNFLMAIFVRSDSLIGNFSIASNFVVLITFFSVPVTTMLFPAFSKVNYKDDHSTLYNVFRYSVKYSTLIVVPIAMIVVTLSPFAIAAIFGNSYKDAPLFLSLLSSGYLLVALGNLCTDNVIKGQGETKMSMKFSLLTGAIGIPMGFILISLYGIIGLIITAIFAAVPSLIISLYWIRSHYKLAIDWKSSAKILFSSFIAAAVTFLVNSKLPFGAWAQLILGLLLYITVFFSALLLTRTLNTNDFENLTNLALSTPRPIRKIIHSLLKLLQTVNDRLTKASSDQQVENLRSNY